MFEIAPYLAIFFFGFLWWNEKKKNKSLFLKKTYFTNYVDAIARLTCSWRDAAMIEQGDWSTASLYHLTLHDLGDPNDPTTRGALDRLAEMSDKPYPKDTFWGPIPTHSEMADYIDGRLSEEKATDIRRRVAEMMMYADAFPFRPGQKP